jgi:hypothetical protein
MLQICKCSKVLCMEPCCLQFCRHEAQESEFLKVTSAGDEPTAHQWCIHIGDCRFWPIHIRTLSFQFPSRYKPMDLEAALKHPAMQQWGALLDLGLLPMCLATKLGELQREGACAASFLGVAMCLPCFAAPPPRADRTHFTSLFGVDEVFTGCSDMGIVTYRGNSIVAAATENADLIISSKLLLMYLCFPQLMKNSNVPIGLRTRGSIKYLFVTMVHEKYPVIIWQGESVCLYMLGLLLQCDKTFLHTQKRGGRGKVNTSATRLLVHCPFRVGGTGSFRHPVGRITKNSFFQYTCTSNALTAQHFAFPHKCEQVWKSNADVQRS